MEVEGRLEAGWSRPGSCPLLSYPSVQNFLLGPCPTGRSPVNEARQVQLACSSQRLKSSAQTPKEKVRVVTVRGQRGPTLGLNLLRAGPWVGLEEPSCMYG